MAREYQPGWLCLALVRGLLSLYGGDEFQLVVCLIAFQMILPYLVLFTSTRYSQVEKSSYFAVN